MNGGKKKRNKIDHLLVIAELGDEYMTIHFTSLSNFSWIHLEFSRIKIFQVRKISSFEITLKR